MLTYRLIDSSNKIQPFILVFSCFLRKHHHVLTICQINSIDSFAREVFWHQLKPPRTRNHQVVGDTNGIPITFQQETPVFFHGQMSSMVPWIPWNHMNHHETTWTIMNPHIFHDFPWQNPRPWPSKEPLRSGWAGGAQLCLSNAFGEANKLEAQAQDADNAEVWLWKMAHLVDLPTESGNFPWPVWI